MSPTDMEREDDRELMLRVGGGSRRAFSDLVGRYEGRLIAYFLRQSGDRELSEDCAQEVFVRLYKARDRYGPQARFSTFLFTIARNYWIDVTRARKVRPIESSLTQDKSGEETMDRSTLLASAEPDPAESLSAAEDVSRLRQALDRLPRGQREVVLLGVIEGMPYADVSEVLGIPVGTVKSRVHAAVRTLRGLLVDDHTQPPGGEPRG